MSVSLCIASLAFSLFLYLALCLTLSPSRDSDKSTLPKILAGGHIERMWWQSNGSAGSLGFPRIGELIVLLNSNGCEIRFGSNSSSDLALAIFRRSDHPIGY